MNELFEFIGQLETQVIEKKQVLSANDLLNIRNIHHRLGSLLADSYTLLYAEHSKLQNIREALTVNSSAGTKPAIQ